jgi:enoyl-CoA hydratase/carnithine racemase
LITRRSTSSARKRSPQLNETITALETDEQVKVVVFDSAVDGFFLTHYDFLAKPEDTTGLPPGPTGLQQLPDMLVRLSCAPVVSIASIRGRATGVGSELALASDMRFASREKKSMERGFHKPGDGENRLGHYVGQLGT